MRVRGLERAIDAPAEQSLLSQIHVHIARYAKGEGSQARHSKAGGKDAQTRSGAAGSNGPSDKVAGGLRFSADGGARIVSCASTGGRLRVRFYAFDASGGGQCAPGPPPFLPGCARRISSLRTTP